MKKKIAVLTAALALFAGLLPIVPAAQAAPNYVTAAIIDPIGWAESAYWDVYLHQTSSFSGGVTIFYQGLRERYGLMTVTGDIIQSEEFKHIEPFYEGLAAFQDKNDKWGYIDTAGKIVIPAKYYQAYPFSEGLACVSTGNVKSKWNITAFGWINGNGEMIIPEQHDTVHALGVFREGLAFVYNRETSQYMAINKSGDKIFDVPAGFALGSHFSDGLINEGSWQGGQERYMDTSGEIVLDIDSAKYDASNFVNGMAYVSRKSGEQGIGFIDNTGKIAIPISERNPRYDRYFSEDMLGVEYDGKWGFIDKSNRLVITPEYDYVGHFSEGLAVAIKDGQMGFIDKTGNEIIPFIYDNVVSNSAQGENASFHDGYALVSKDSKWHIIRNPLIGGDTSKNDMGNFTFSEKDGVVVADSITFNGKTVNAYYRYNTETHAYDEDICSLKNYTGIYEGLGYSGRFIDYYGLNCASLVKRFHKIIYGAEISGLVRNSTPQDANGVGNIARVSAPQAGDIVSEDNGGHWMIVKSVDGNVVTVIEQNRLQSVGKTIVGRKISVSGSGHYFYRYTPRNPVPDMAHPTTSSIFVDGKLESLGAYNINGNNYFKLRDLAFVLNGTKKQFNIDWNSSANEILLTSGQSYIPVGGEMSGIGDGMKIPVPTSANILLDFRKIHFTAYNIGGNNYFKLRDVAAALDFGVTWDGAAQRITIDTGTGYTPE